MTTAAPGPVAETGRAQVLDALRGFALLGILVSHVPTFSGYEFLPPDRQALLDGLGIDAWLARGSEMLVRGKFYSLFSLLFGIGFAIQLESAARQGAAFRRRFARRLGWLLAIGLLHALLWYGDILVAYALLGFALIPTARWSAEKTLRAAAIALTVRAVWGFAMLALLAPAGPGAPAVIAREAGAVDVDAGLLGLVEGFAWGGPAQVFRANLEFLELKALQLVYDGKLVSIFAMFLLGSVVGKRGLFRRLGDHRLLFRRMLLWGGAVGLAGNALLVPIHAATPAFPPTLQRAGENLLFAVAVPSLALAYAAGFALLAQRPGARRLLRWLAAPGRMALTTYLSQTVVCLLLFYGGGLGLMWSLGQLGCLVAALAIFSLQSWICAWWLRHFRFGPVEWCWRRATYGVPLPLRRAPEPSRPRSTSGAPLPW